MVARKALSLLVMAMLMVDPITAGRTHNGHETADPPVIFPYPLTTGKKFVTSPKRTKTCFVDALGNGKDDGPNILAAFKKCNNGGTVALLDELYTVGTALDLTFLKHVNLDIQGTIKFTDDTEYWQKNSFKYTFQNSSSFWQFGGEDVNIYGSGKGIIDGSGQAWYDLYAAQPLILRPILIAYNGLRGGTVSGLKLRYSPQWYQIVIDSSSIIFDTIDIAGDSASKNPAKNTDGWDTYRSDNIVIQNSIIKNGDDCVSFKPNSTNVLVQSLSCDGSHGISVGSLGQYKGVYDLVEDIYVFNVSMANASDGARIKVWPNVDSAMSVDLQGGGGTGMVNNVTFDTMLLKNVDYAIELTQCYGQKNMTICEQYPSELVIQNVLFKGLYGTASKKYDPQVGTLICSSPTVCHNIWAQNINTVPPSGKAPKYTCTNMDNSLLQIPCI